MSKITSNTKNKRKDLPEKLLLNNTTVVEIKKLLKILISTLQTLAPTSHPKYLRNKEVL